MLKIYKSVITLTFLAFTTNLFAQGTLNGSQKEGLMQLFKVELSQLKQTYNDNAQFTAAFNNYYNTIFTTDRQTYCALIMSSKLSAAKAKAYMSKLSMKYDSMHAEFVALSIAQPGVLTQYKPKHQFKQAFGNCNPNDTNLNFTNGYLTEWYAYYANNISVSSYDVASYVGGECGNINAAANDPNTNFLPGSADYQIAIKDTQVDPIVSSIPVIPPGAKYSVRIGDSTNPNNGVGQLQQSFVVTPANENFTYQYSLFLENPTHPVTEKPFYQFQVFDSIGNVACYNLLYTGNDLKAQGYDSIYYAPSLDYVYYTNWQKAHISLKHFEGHCITISFTVSDCSLGAHFGYGYFAFENDTLAIKSSYNVVCGGNPVTLTAPAAASYAWSGPAGAITTANTLRTVSVNEPGNYSVIIVNGKKGSCITDTLHYTLNAGTAKAAINTTPYYCSGAEGTATALPYGVAPYTYSWSNGQTTSAINNLAPGIYNISATDSKGCVSVDTASIDSTGINMNLTATSSIVEYGDSVSLSASSPIAYPLYNYQWSPNSSVRYADSASTYVYPKTTTIYTVTAQWLCGTVTDTLTIHKGCNLTVGFTIAKGCKSNTPYGIITATSNGGGAPYTYKWSTGSTSSTDSVSASAIYSVIITDNNGCTASANRPTKLPGGITAPLSITQSYCTGLCTGSIAPNASGGYPPYTYMWNTGATAAGIGNLCPGTYTVTIKDTVGCILTANATLTIPVPFALSKSVMPTACSGSAVGSACVTVSGGTAPYTYFWSNSTVQACVFNIATGNYSVTITDAHGCEDSASFFVPTSVLKASVFAFPDTICPGASSLLGAGAAGSIVGSCTWSWSPGNLKGQSINVTPPVTTTYTVTASDSYGCTSPPVTITVYAGLPLSLSLTASHNPLTSGDTVSLSAIASGSDSYSYAWSPPAGLNSSTAQHVIATLSSSTQYYATVNDNCGRRIMDSIYVLVDTNFAGLYIDSLIKGGCNNSLWIATTGAASLSQFSFAWSTGATTDTITNLCAGTYSVTITDNTMAPLGKQPTITLHITIISTVGINQIQNSNLFTIYPVPATSNLNISLSNSTFQPTYLSVYDITGRQVAKQNISFKHNTETIDVSSLANGTYMLMLSDGKTNSQAKFTVIH